MRLGLGIGRLGMASPRRVAAAPTEPDNLWSNAATWVGYHGHVPTTGEDVTIEAGQTVVLDSATASIGQLVIEGTLEIAPAATSSLTCESIHCEDGGRWQAGTSGSPVTGEFTVTLTGARGTHTENADDNGLANDAHVRGIMVHDDFEWVMHGSVPALLKTKLNASASASATSFTLANAVTWESGTQVAIGMTDFLEHNADLNDEEPYHGTEILELASAITAGTAMSTTGGLAAARYGVLQYPVDTLVSGRHIATSQNTFTAPSADTPLVLDERAEVLHLTRKIIIQGANDTDWTDEGFGAHVMVMDLAATVQLKGVAFIRCGQRRATGRYPFHWHMLSYVPFGDVGSGDYIDDVAEDQQWLEDCVVYQSSNRAYTIHGTCGVRLTNCFAVDVVGHAFFMEDGSEERNTIEDCKAMLVRDPGPTLCIKLHEDHDPFQQRSGENGASGFWITNLNNTLLRNTGSDCAGRGFWQSLATQCFGLSRDVDLDPSTIEPLLWEDNEGHSCFRQGIATEFAVTNEAGTTAAHRYDPGIFTFTRGKHWKNGRPPRISVGAGYLGTGQGGYQNRVGAALYVGWTAADNEGRDFHGQSLGATMTGVLCVWKSLNNATAFVDPNRIAVASYHSQLDFVDPAFVDYPLTTPVMQGNGQFFYAGGAIDLTDLYDRFIALGFARNTGWYLLGSSPGMIPISPYFDGEDLATPNNPALFRYWSLPVLWDPQGYWGDAGNYLIPDDPFYTYDLNGAADAIDRGYSTPDLFYGIGDIVVDDELTQFEGPSLITLKCERLEKP